MFANNDPILQIYFKDLPKGRRLSTKEELELSHRIKTGDIRALNTLVTANLLFVVKVAHNYLNQGMDLQDLISVGNIGLIKAARSFDGSRNFKFITYAVWWIRQHILTALADQSRVVRVPLNTACRLYKLRKARNALTQGNDRSTDAYAIAEHMKLKVKDVDMLLALEIKPLFLDAPIDYEKNRELTDCVKTEGEFYDGVDDKIRDLRELLSHLPERERDILVAYYGLDGGVPMTLEQISKKYGVSRERIRQVKDATLKSIRSGLSIRSTSSTNLKK